MDYGVPLGRRFRALKLWFVLRYFGRQGLIAELRRQIELAQSLRRMVEADARFEVTAPAPFSTVCFRKRGAEAENRWIAATINRSGEFFISQTILRGSLRCGWQWGTWRRRRRIWRACGGGLLS